MQIVDVLKIVNVLIGGSLLIWGRRLFWLFVAAAGFIVGWDIATRNFNGPAWVAIAIGIIAAVIAAMLAVFLKKVAIGVAGFLMGAWLMVSLAAMLGMDQGLAYWGFFLVGGVAGVILIGLFFNFALIWLSSLAGTTLIMTAVSFVGIVRVLVFIVILFLGVILQTSLWGKEDDD
jgi:ammonia channel protein AmtB